MHVVAAQGQGMHHPARSESLEPDIMDLEQQYVLGTYAGLLCMWMLKVIAGV